MLGFIRRRIWCWWYRRLVRRGFVITSARTPLTDRDYVLGFICKQSPDVVLDIGANEGQFASKLRAAGYRGRIVSFEPQAQPYAALARKTSADENWECHQMALGAGTGELTMHVSGSSVSSSLYPIGKRHVQLMPESLEVKSEAVRSERLDDWTARRSDILAGNLFVKIDVQGYEAPLLRGASRVLRVAKAVYIELIFAELYDGQSKYHDVMRLLEEAGLRFFALMDVNACPKTDEFLWADALFVRPGSYETL